MEVFTTYSVKIQHYNHIFKDTLTIYRSAVDYLIGVCLAEWDDIANKNSHAILLYLESLIHGTKANPRPAYDFDVVFYKFPSYLRRSAIMNAYGLVCSYKSNLARHPHPEKCKPPKAGFSFPVMYRDNTFRQDPKEPYKAKLKVFIRNTWDWLDVGLKKGNVDYILHHCSDKKEHAPTLVKRGKEYFLAFQFAEKVSLKNTDIKEQIAVAVDLGLNSACVCSVMRSSGTILDRRFLSLPKEEDSLMHATNRIKKAQRLGARRTPKLWAAAKGINDRIAVLTAQFIMAVAEQWNADVIVFEHLDLKGKKKGSKKQRLHLWKAQYIQGMVTSKAHRKGMRVRRICAKNTSKVAFDGSGEVERGKDGNYSICKFQTGKLYNCDLSASYNIGARYFVKELLKPLRATVRLDISAKVPECSRRTTLTLSSLINLNAVLAASSAVKSLSLGCI